MLMCFVFITGEVPQWGRKCSSNSTFEHTRQCHNCSCGM